MPYNSETAKKRWNISQMQIARKFCGWETLKKMMKSCNENLRGPHNEKLLNTPEQMDEAEGLIATVFQTGCRICEAIGQKRIDGTMGMKPTDFSVFEDRVAFVFEIEKRYTKIGRQIQKYKAVDRSKLRWDTLEEANASGRPHEEYMGYMTERQIKLRNNDFSRLEPLVPHLLAWKKIAQENDQEHLFNYLHRNYNKAYRIVKATGRIVSLDFPPHRLRAERATQLRLEANMSSEELQNWFSWKSVKEAINYTTLAPQTQAKMYNPEYLSSLPRLEAIQV
ncbi:MAG: hypothetical protein KKE05_01100 [Nanoarchaeota archaeon]|nr:hypothetical protein [Nanoarchaeota archaeon]